MSGPGYQKRIRAVVQNLNLDFADNIARRGHCREVTDSKDASRISKGVIPITRDGFLDYIERLMKRTKGRELPETFNPMIVSDLFLEQSTPWEAIARSQVEQVWKAAKEFLGHAAAYVADATTSKALIQKIFEPALNHLMEILNEKTTELLTPHQRSHPITYNHYFTETLQKLRNERNQKEYSKIIKQFFGVSSLEKSHYCGRSHDLCQLVTALVQRTEPDMNRFACSEALDCMEAYYKAALKRFIDDMAIEVIEAKLISQIGGIFTPVAVSAMSADLVTSMAGESEENRAQREQLIKQLEVLRKGSDTCKHFVGIGLLDADDAPHSDPESNNDPASDGPVDSDEASRILLDEDVRSSADEPVGLRRPSNETLKHAIEVEIAPSAPYAVPEVSGIELDQLRLASSKKSRRKSRISALSVSEED
ncbi:MAG: hypothetical protein M1836_006372 [Candelina mexicana]|nr:MAG: hypothetical protein M1836_006372 [Candelina mexicana]